MDRVLRLHGLMRNIHKKGIPVLPDLIRKYIRVFYACDIFYTTKIGRGTRFPHGGLGVVIHKDAQIGEECVICQNVTIGGRGGNTNVPILGNNVLVGTGAVILGPITIGDNVQIGANSVVLDSIPSNSVVVGSPARVVKTYNKIT